MGVSSKKTGSSITYGQAKREADDLTFSFFSPPGEPFLQKRELGELVRFCKKELHCDVSIVSWT